MIYPIVAYGDPVLKRKCEEIDENYEGLSDLIEDMTLTMDNASGVGLAAPQIGKSIRLFIVDATPFAEDEEIEEEEREFLSSFKRVFINPIILEEEGDKWAFQEGCLSIPDIREDVMRKPKLTIEYYNQDFELIEEELSGIAARIVQHEYDHIEGTLFTDRISSLKRRLLKGKLNDIAKGNIDPRYKMRFYKK